LKELRGFGFAVRRGGGRSRLRAENREMSLIRSVKV
jgi:hypothetical protein